MTFILLFVVKFIIKYIYKLSGISFNKATALYYMWIASSFGMMIM